MSDITVSTDIHAFMQSANKAAAKQNLDLEDSDIKTSYENNSDTNAFTDTEKTKLSNIATGAQVNTVDSVNTQTGSVVLNADHIDDASTTHKFATAAQLTIIDSVESGATADQTGAEIKTAYEGESNTNAFTDDEKTKLSGIDESADVTDATTVSAAGAPIISSGSGTPSSTPSKIGDIYIDTSSDDAYIAVGTASSSDWEISNDGAGSGSTNLSWTASTSTVSSSTGTNATLTDADSSNAGLMSSSDKTKLDGISISTFGATLVDDADAAAARTTLGVDPAGTDNSTAVTITGSGTYVSLAGQELTVDPITESDISDLQTYLTSNAVDSVNGATGTVVLNADNIDDASTTHKFVTDSDLTTLGNTSGTNTGDQDLSGYLQNLSADSTPELGGPLDVNGQDIVTSSDGNIQIDPNGSGVTIFKGNSTKGSGQFKLNCEDNTHGITIKGPPHSANADYTLTFPDNDGDDEQVLKTDGSGNLSWVTPSQVSINTQTGTTYTTVATDASKLITLNNASAITLTIPPNSSVAYAVGTKIDLAQIGAGQVTVAAGAGVTVNATPTLKLRAQYSGASCIQYAADTWILAGDLASS